MQVIIEPPDLFLRRAEEKQREVDRILSHPTEHLSGWDDAIMRFFIARPNAVMLQVRVANELVGDECHIIVDWNRCQIIVDLSLRTKLSLNILF